MNCKIKIPERFEEHFKKQFGEEIYEEYLKFSLKPIKKAIRVNTLKISINELLSSLEDKGMSFEKIPWVKEGFWVNWEVNKINNSDANANKKEKKKRFDLGNTIEHFLGYYYVQEAASMIPPLLLEPKENEIVLDLAAAPGSKTTQMAQYMKNMGTIVANDKDANRTKILAMNIQRMGITNTIITKKDGRNFKYTRFRPKKILLDAPCSATGAIRKSYDVLHKFSLKSIKSLSNLQKQLLANAFEILQEGGSLVYSTCSVDIEENELVLDYFLKKFENAKLEKIDLEGLKKDDVFLYYNNKELNPEIKKAIRILPQTNDTEGFFIAKIKKL